MIGKIEALLRKAESTDSGPEAEALLAKAQELMAKYAIDEMMLDRAAGTAKVKAEPVSIVFEVGVKGGKGVEAQTRLLNTLCEANGVRLVTLGGMFEVGMVGYQSDVDLVLGLFQSLRLVMIGSEVRARVTRPTWEHPTTFKVSFYNGFSNRMRHRITVAARAGRADAVAEHGTGAEVALVDRSRSVGVEFARVYPRVSNRRTGGSRSNSSAGYRQGQAAADRADMGQTRVGQRRSIGGAA